MSEFHDMFSPTVIPDTADAAAIFDAAETQYKTYSGREQVFEWRGRHMSALVGSDEHKRLLEMAGAA